MLEKWLVKAGDSIKMGDTMAHVSIGDLIVGVETEFSGVVAQIRYKEGDKVPSNTVIAFCVDSKEDYTKFLEFEVQQFKSPSASAQETKAAVFAATVPPTATNPVSTVTQGSSASITDKKADIKDVLREIKVLIKEGHIVEESGTFIIYF